MVRAAYQLMLVGIGVVVLLSSCTSDDGPSNVNTRRCENADCQATPVTLTPADTTFPKTATLQARLQAQEEIDIYRIELRDVFTDRPGTLEVKTSGSTDTSGTLIQFNNGIREELASGDDGDRDQNFCFDVETRNFCFSRELGNGTYFIEVLGFNRFTTSDYTLHISLLGPDDQHNTIDIAQSLPPIAFDVPLERALESEGDIDVFHLQLAESPHHKLTVQTETIGGDNGSTDTFGRLLEQTTQGENIDLAEDDDSGGNGNFSITASNLPSGSYFVEVTGFDRHEVGPYVLIAFIDDHGDLPQTATMASLNQSLDGHLESADDIDVFRIELTERGTITANTSAAPDHDRSTDTRGTLLHLTATNDLEVIAEDDDGGDDGNFFIMAENLSPGAYFVEVRGFLRTITGRYQLNLHFEP